MIPIAILCGGLGTRLRPLTHRRPKSLVEVGGKPFIDHQLALLKRSGFTDVVLCIGHKGHAIQGHVALGDLYGLRVRYSHDGPTTIGTASALRKALPKLGQRFFVLYGDVYPRIDFTEMLETADPNSLARMAVYRTSRGNVGLVEDGVLYNKTLKIGAYSDAGVLLLNRSLLTSYPHSDLATLLAFCESLSVYKTERSFEMGSHEGLAKADAYLKGINYDEKTSSSH